MALQHARAQAVARAAGDEITKAKRKAADALARDADGLTTGKGLPPGALRTKDGDVVLMLPWRRSGEALALLWARRCSGAYLAIPWP